MISNFAIASIFVTLSLCSATLISPPSAYSDNTAMSFENMSSAVAVRGKRQCGGMGGCCAGQCGGCGQMGMCGQTCCSSSPCSCGSPGCMSCPSPQPQCTCGTPGCMQCVTQTVLVPVQQTTCCKCCQPVCTNACVNGGGCSCGCTRGGCSRKRRSLLEIASQEMNKTGDHTI